MFCFGSNEKLVPKPAVCVRDRSLSVETSGSIHDSPTAVPERQNINEDVRKGHLRKPNHT